MRAWCAVVFLVGCAGDFDEFRVGAADGGAQFDGAAIDQAVLVDQASPRDQLMPVDLARELDQATALDMTLIGCAGWSGIEDGGTRFPGCWYEGALGASCDETCAMHGGFDSAATTHQGDYICQRFNGFNWATGGAVYSIECANPPNDCLLSNGLMADGTIKDPKCQMFCSCFH